MVTYSTIFSIFPREADVHVSASLESAGHWELRLTYILQYTLRSYPRAVFINLGANIGYYTLLAASMGHQVIGGQYILIATFTTGEMLKKSW